MFNCISYSYGVGATFLDEAQVSGLRSHMLYVTDVAYRNLHVPITKYTLSRMDANYDHRSVAYTVTFDVRYGRFFFTGSLHQHWLLYGGACDILCHLVAMKEYQFANRCN